MKLLKKLLVPIGKPLLTKIHQYKDVHHGESCYIFLNGISLKWFNLNAFSDKIGIATAFIPFHKDFNKLQVKYSLLAEPWWFYTLQRYNGPPKKIIKNQIQEVYRKIIKQYPDKAFFVNLSNYPVLRSKNITYLFNDIYDERLSIDFITHRINAFHGSLRTSILLAIYFGFDHCYLVGGDYTHVPSRSLHFYEKGQGIFEPHEDYSKDFFEIAKEFIDITTITLDGTSDVLNAITYKEHTGLDPVFRENTELLDEQYLNVLAKWPGYSIL